jgi:hypothetical protein
MKTKTQSHFTVLKIAVCAIVAVGLAAVAHAQATVDPTGTWTWANAGRNGNPGRTNTLTLKYTGGALSGSLSAPGRGGAVNNSPISNGTLTGDKIAFDVTREFNGNTMTANYEGTVTADSIKGKIGTERDGEKHSRKWEAKREGASTP